MKFVILTLPLIFAAQNLMAGPSFREASEAIVTLNWNTFYGREELAHEPRHTVTLFFAHQSEDGRVQTSCNLELPENMTSENQIRIETASVDLHKRIRRFTAPQHSTAPPLSIENIDGVPSGKYLDVFQTVSIQLGGSANLVGLFNEYAKPENKFDPGPNLVDSQTKTVIGAKHAYDVRLDLEVIARLGEERPNYDLVVALIETIKTACNF